MCQTVRFERQESNINSNYIQFIKIQQLWNNTISNCHILSLVLEYFKNVLNDWEILESYGLMN